MSAVTDDANSHDAVSPIGAGQGSDGTPGGLPDSLSREFETRLANVRLSQNDERVLGFVRDHLDELAFHTSESIAQGAGVSRAAVVRFARRLGYSGFAALRSRHRQLLRGTASSDTQSGEEELSMLDRKIRRDAENLAVLPAMLGSRLDEAAQKAANARSLWLLANRETYGLIVYFHRLLHHVRSNLQLVDPSFPDPLRDISAGDTLLACTFRPYARQTLALADHAREAGAAVVAVTDGYGQRFLAESDTVLALPVESPTMFLSFVAATSVLEALAAYVARLDVDATYETLESTGRFIHGQRMMVEPGLPTGKRRH